MGKTDHRVVKNSDMFSKQDILEDENRKAKKHRKSFSEYLEEDEDYQSFYLSKPDFEDIDEETLKKYLR